MEKVGNFFVDKCVGTLWEGCVQCSQSFIVSHDLIFEKKQIRAGQSSLYLPFNCLGKIRACCHYKDRIFFTIDCAISKMHFSLL